MTDVDATREHICDIGRRLWQGHMCGGNGGNISVRTGDDEILATPTNISKGFMKPDDLCTIDLQGNQLSGDRGITSEIKLHLEIYKARPDVKAVVHAHSPYLTAFAVTGRRIPVGIMAEMDVIVGPIPMIEYAQPGTEQLARSITRHVKKATTAILAHHGPLSWGTDLEQAYFRLEVAEHYCHILTVAWQVGIPKPLPTEQLKQLLESKREMGLLDDPRL